MKSVATLNNKPVKLFQLDTFKIDNELQHLYDTILKHINNNKSTSGICFSSPEMLLNPKSIDFVILFISSKKINLFCIDEVHLFVEFAISFRLFFQSLKNNIISLLYKDKNTIHIPLLLMSVTFDKSMYHMIQAMLDIQIHSNNIF